MTWQSLSQFLDSMKLIDLSHTLEEQIPAVPTHSKFGHQLWHSYAFGDVALTYNLTMNEHSGTHVDAYSHFIQEGEAHQHIDEIPLEKFCGPCVKIDLSFLGPKGEATDQHVRDWEKKHGPIQPGDVVLIDFGWSKYWKKRPHDYDFVHNHPGVGASLAKYLVEKQVRLVGVDTISVDVCDTTEFPAHYTLLGNQIPIAENLKNLDQIESRGIFMAFPLPIKEGSGSPVRAVAWVPKS
jgi:kynurenine formamidase